MSRVGRKTIAIPPGVTVKRDGTRVSVKGPKGDLDLDLRPEVEVEIDDGVIRVRRLGSERNRVAGALFGTTRALLQNMVTGVSEGYERRLEISGVGYNAQLSGSNLVLNLGFSHSIDFPIPGGLAVECPSPTTVVVRGCDKQQVGQFAARIRRLRPPEPYKGKGVKYSDEVIRRKAGKAFGSA